MLENILNKECIKMNLKGKTKDEVIKELAFFLCKQYNISEKEVVLSCILDRESKMSTGIEFGVAIPHGKINLTKNICAVIGISKAGIDFNSLDKKPTYIIIMTLSGSSCTGLHVQFLSEISRLLTQENIRKNILNSKNEEEILNVFLGK